MSNEINPSYQKLIDGFTMTRTKDGKGRGVRVNIWIDVYPDGHVHCTTDRKNILPTKVRLRAPFPSSFQVWNS
jgi:hypothetical protein